MRVGIDFGTTYTKIAYMEDGELKLFQYPGEQGSAYIPTAISYRAEGSRQVVHIGKAAQLQAMNVERVEYAERFKMFLPVWDEQERARQGWSLPRRPDEVTRDFFQYLLRVSENSLERFFKERKINRIVVSVPELWQRTANNFGAEALRRILQNELGLPLDHLRSEPVCAAAYFVYEYQRSARSPGDAFNLLVCDVGGGTFDVALCRVQGQKIDVLDFDGMGQEGWGAAGALFDRNAVQTALAQRGETPSVVDMIELLRAFEECKIASHDEFVALWNLLKSESEQRLRDTEVYRFRRKYSLTFSQVRECFVPVDEAIRKVLKRILHRCRERQYTIDRIAIVGGFGQFPLVQDTILHTLGVHDPDDPRFDQTLHSQHRQFCAVAYGAALIANGIIQPAEYYPHTLAVLVHREATWEQLYLPVVQAGEVPAGTGAICWASKQGKRVAVKVVQQKVGVLPVFIRLQGSGKWLNLDLPPAEYPEPGQYYVGISIDRSNMGTLVFESVDGRRRREYRLGDINPVLTVEE